MTTAAERIREYLDWHDENRGGDMLVENVRGLPITTDDLREVLRERDILRNAVKLSIVHQDDLPGRSWRDVPDSDVDAYVREIARLDTELKADTE